MSQAYKENFKEIDWSGFRPSSRPRQAVPAARSSFPAPMVVRDEMPPVQSQATGKMYDSKSAIRREYRQLGMTEVGNEKLKPRVRQPKSDRNAIKTTIEKAVARFNRGERAR